MVNASRQTSTSLAASTHKLHPMMGAAIDAAQAARPFLSRSRRTVRDGSPESHSAIATKLATRMVAEDIGEASALSCARARGESFTTKRSVFVASSDGEDHGTACQVVQCAFAV